MKFAHIADSHLGAFSKNPKLKELNIKAFEYAIDLCIKEGVDFIIIAGDLFHNPLPDMETVHRAVKILNRARERGINIYVVYGSHDFSAGTTSLLDVLSEAGVFIKATKYVSHGSKIRLLPVVDEKTGVKIVGMPGLTAAMEVRYFNENAIDVDYLEGIDGKKIFVFHTTVAELKPSYLSDQNAVPISKFPRGFDYYAGGHLHERIVGKIGNAPLIYPGTLFGSNYSDLEILSGNPRGFYIVEDFRPKFVPVKVCDFEMRVFDATGRTAEDVERDLLDFASQDHGGKVVILKVKGILKSGKIADIDFRKIREKILHSALDVLLNTYSLTTEERKIKRIPGNTPEEIENRIFGEISDYGIEFTRNLFRILKEERKEGEKVDDYKQRIWNMAYPLLLKVVEKKRMDLDKGVQNKTRVERGRKVSLFDFG